jgi:glycolate oxidase iron-sulfur subunit
VEAAIRVLQKNRFQVAIPEQGCCGLPMSYYGYEKEALYNARKIIDNFGNSEIEAVVSTCGSCTERLKDYANLFADDGKYRESAKFISSISYDISEFLMKYSEELALELPDKLNLRAAYHDSCHLVAAGVTEQPRKILEKIVKVPLEIKEGCCGGAGGYTFLHTEKSKKIFDLKVESIKNISPDCIVSICPGCVLQFKEGLQRNKISAESLNLVQLLDRYYELNDIYNDEKAF